MRPCGVISAESQDNSGAFHFVSLYGLALEDRAVPVRRTYKLSSPIYASAMGLMDLIIDTIESRNAPTGGGIKEFFRSLLGG